MRNSADDALDFSAVFDAAPGIYLVLDANFNMVAANEARLKATMMMRQDVIGRNLFEVFPDNPDDPAADGVRNLRRSLERVLQTKRADSMAVQKYDIPRPQELGGGFEERYWSPLNTPVIDGDGNVKYIIHRVEDVTDFMALKQKEAQLQSHAERIENEIYLRAKEVQAANRKLEEANAELSRLNGATQDMAATQQRFFSQISHELRTPLTLILGPLERLLKDAREFSPTQVQTLQGIARNARTLLRHVNDLLDVVKHNATGLSVAYGRGDLAERVRVAAAHFDSASTGRALRLGIETPNELIAEFDAEKIDRVLINLLSNAYKFTPDGGTIDCRLIDDGGEAVVTIADSGPGVPPHLRETIFEPFKQGDEGLTRHSSGTGLGLAIVRDFVALHHGVVRVGDSASGGAVFEIRLPLRAPDGAVVSAGAAAELEQWNFQQAVEAYSAPVAAAATERAAGDGARVLIVDDNHDMADFIAAILSPACVIEIARNGREGLRKAEETAPDVIITDLMMPEMSGYELALALRRRSDLRDIPVLMLTARADDETRIRALQDGAADFLAKPFSVDELKARVTNLIRGKQAADLAKRDKRISDEKYAQLMDGARDAVFILASDGVILDANRQGAVFCGRQPALLIGALLEEALDVVTAAGAASPFLGDDVFELEARALEFGGGRRVFEGTSAAVHIDGQSFRLVIVREVTERRRLEAQLRHSQKLDALGQLTGGIAHDFNNLLTVVGANAEAVHMRVRDRPEVASLVANIERAVDGGAAMTRRLLAFARRQDIIEVELCDVNVILGNAVEMLRRMLPAKVSVETAFDETVAPVLIDARQLEDVVLNLAINARDAMPDGGVLRVASFTATRDAGEGEPVATSCVCVSVTDSGEGMSADVLARVFEPFFTTKGEGKGTGLGLSMVYGFARNAGGDVRVESTLGVGTRVTVELPSRDRAA